MKVMTLSAALLVIMSLFLLTPSARAQDTYDPGVDGYTYIDYDPDTDLVTAYSETDTDYDIACDYEAYVSLSVTDDSGADQPGACRPRPRALLVDRGLAHQRGGYS